MCKGARYGLYDSQPLELNCLTHCYLRKINNEICLIDFTQTTHYQAFSLQDFAGR